jgi:transcriptional regulator with XRE-family HTH domain
MQKLHGSCAKSKQLLAPGFRSVYKGGAGAVATGGPRAKKDATMKVRITAAIAGLVRRRRMELNLTIKDLADSLATNSFQAKVDSSVISRIESEQLESTGEEKLRAIAVALKLDDQDFLIRMSKTVRDASLRIGVVHTIFSAPLFAAAHDMNTKGVTMSSFGEVSNHGEYIPKTSNLSSNGDRELWRQKRPTPEGSDEVDEEDLERNAAGDAQFYGDKALSDNWRSGFSVFCSGPEIHELWRKGEIDVAVVAREIFAEHMRPGAVREAISCGTIGASRRSAAFIFLFDPEKWIQNKLSIPAIAKAWRNEDKDPPAAFMEQFKEFHDNLDIAFKQLNRGGKSSGEINVICPESTFVVDHIRELNLWARDRWGGFLPVSVNMGDYERFRAAAFEEARKSGLVVLSAWEPFTTYLRQDWERSVRKKIKVNSLVLKWFANAAVQQIDKDEFGRPDEIEFSFERSIGRLFGELHALSIPQVTMDIVISREYLTSLGTTGQHVLTLFEVLDRTVADIRKSCAEYARFMPFSALRDGSAGNSLEREALVRYSAGEGVTRVAQYFDIPLNRCLRALSEVDFRLSFHPSFVNYLLTGLRGTRNP